MRCTRAIETFDVERVHRHAREVIRRRHLLAGGGLDVGNALLMPPCSCLSARKRAAPASDREA
jgi:hypothetical protein